MGKGKREGFKQNLLSEDDKEVTVKMQYFETVECIIKIGRVSKQVDTKSKNANFFLLLDFISNGFPKIINHQNHFKNYCKTIYLFRDWFKLFSQQFFWGTSEPTSNASTTVSSLNLRADYNSFRYFEIQFLKAITPAFLITRSMAAIFPTLLSMKCFLKQNYLMGMIHMLLLKGKKCALQYKSATDSNSMEKFLNEKNLKTVCLYGIAEHSNGEDYNRPSKTMRNAFYFI